MGRPKGSLNKNTGARYFSAAQGKRPVSAKPENFGEQISKTHSTAKPILIPQEEDKAKREKDLELKVAGIIHDECGVPGCWAKFHQETARQIINLLRIEGV